MKVKRTYNLGRRAEQQEATRRKIVEAAVALHGSLGPGRTTLSMVAERAGVQRHTLYAHFPANEVSISLARDLRSSATRCPTRLGGAQSQTSANDCALVSRQSMTGTHTMPRWLHARCGMLNITH